MFKNYLKTAWRNITRTIGYSMLNILGLATGMAVALLIGLWVHDQYNYDRFLPDYKQLYRVQRNFNSNGDTLTFQSTSLRLSEALRSGIPEIEYVAESDWMVPHGLMVGDKKIVLSGGQTGSDFLKMFRFPLIAGNADNALQDPFSIVLTQSTAKALFGNADPMNKMVRFENRNDMKVTGILKDLPANGSFDFHFIVPFSYLAQRNPDIKASYSTTFGNNPWQLFVKLKPGISYAQVAPKIREIEHIEKGNRNAMNSFVTLQPMERWHLYSNYVNGKDTAGFLDYVKMFSVIGALVLLIACINFINLTTARSEKRAKEVGVRKAIGSLRRDLIIQFLSESFLLTLIAFIFSLLFVLLALTPFNALTGNTIVIPYSSWSFWLAMFACIFLTSMIGGSRPAFYLSSFRPVQVLKGTMQVGKAGSLPRKILVVLQFSCSIALIISTIIIYQQISYAKDRPNGYDLNRLVQTDMNSDLDKNFTAIKNELVQNGIVSGVTTASSSATDVSGHSDIDQWPGKNGGETVEMGNVLVTEDYFSTMGMKIAAGRGFANMNDSGSVVFNEAAIRRLRIKNPVSQSITYNGKKYQVVGVVKDALMESPFAAADPTMFRCMPGTQDVMIYRLSPQVKTQDALAQTEYCFF